MYAEYDPDTKSGTPGSESRKVKGNIHWLSCVDAVEAEIRMYDRLFAVPAPGARRPDDPDDLERDFLEDINPEAKRVLTGWVEPALADCAPEACYQWERNGYFVADQYDHAPGKPVFNRTVTLRDSWTTK